ncbi:MAG: pyridoxal phosphate-dependent aminotransferase [Acidobacteriota bacterium]
MPSATLAINERSAELVRKGHRILKLGLGQSPFPVPAPVVEALKENAHQKDYLPVKGLPALRESVAEYHRRKHGIARSARNVLVGPGSKELMFLIQLVYYGDLVVPTPSWVSYAPQAQIIGRHVRWLPTQSKNRWQLQADELEALCATDPDRPRLVILNYPNNPTGHTYDIDHLRALAGVARRYRVVMLSDEIYGEIHHMGKHVSIAEFYPEGTIISSGLSKWCGAGGWRLGTFTFPDGLRWLLDSMAVVASETFTSTSAPIQYAAVRAFQGGDLIEQYLLHCRRILRTLGRYCAAQLRSIGVDVRVPQGAFYLFPNFRPFRRVLRARGITTSDVLCERLLEETGVATIPGSSCGREKSELTMRMAFVDFDGAKALSASEAVGMAEELNETFLRSYCGNVTSAIDRICEWAQERS